MIRVELKPFREAVAKAAAVVKPKSPKPILQYVLLVAEGESVTIRGTDLEVSVEVFCAASVHAPLRVALPADKLRACLTVAKGSELTIEIDKAFVVLRSDTQRWSLQTMAADEFPVEPPISGAAWELPERALKASLRVRKACDTESARYTLTGIAFHASGGQRYAVATDGRAMMCQELGRAVGDDRMPLLPGRAAATLANLLDDVGDASIEDDTRRMAVTTGSVKFSAALLDGRFPQWQKAVPQSFAAEVTIKVEEFASILRSAAVTTTLERLGVTLTLKDGELTAAAEAGNVGESEASTPVAFSGDPATVCIDPGRVLEFLSECDRAATVTLGFSGEDTAIRMATDDGFWGIVMPLS